MFAIAIAKFLTGKDVEAANFLKLCGKLNYQPEFGEELEKAWLLHAESYIKINKSDNAEDVLRNLLKENKSCGKAQELMGLIREKDLAYADAAEFYEKAFDMTSRKAASIGYRLAYNYFKAKRYVECLEICRQVTESHPNYTIIKTEIEEKAIMAIR